jgi:hypothetical protein
MNAKSLFVNAKALLVIPFVLLACSSTSEEEADESLDELTAGRGQTCGGFAGTPCAEGLRCNYRAGSGTCVDNPNAVSQGADEDEVCGGTTNIKCKTGLECKTSTGNVPAAGRKGKCVAVALAGCRGLPACDAGHNAVSSASDCIQDDDAECYKRTTCGRSVWCTAPAPSAAPAAPSGAGVGERCGGFAGKRCAPGLRCDNSLGINTGYCR